MARRTLLFVGGSRFTNISRTSSLLCYRHRDDDDEEEEEDDGGGGGGDDDDDDDGVLQWRCGDPSGA